MMAAVMLQQRRWHVAGTVVSAVMDEQVPGVGDQASRKKIAAGNEIGEREADPYLPEQRKHGHVGMSMMLAMSRSV